MLGVKAVAERVADHIIRHHPTMPGVGKTAQAVLATRRLKDCLHAFMMTTVPHLVAAPPPKGETVAGWILKSHAAWAAVITPFETNF